MLTSIPQQGEEETLTWNQCGTEGFVGMEQSAAHVPSPCLLRFAHASLTASAPHLLLFCWRTAEETTMTSSY